MFVGQMFSTKKRETSINCDFNMKTQEFLILSFLPKSTCNDDIE